MSCRLSVTTISTNERTFIRTIVKWSKPAVIFTVVIVLLAAYVFVQKAYAQPLEQVSYSLVQTQKEVSKTLTQLEEEKSEKAKLHSEVQVREQKITQLEQENAELKD